MNMHVYVRVMRVGAHGLVCVCVCARDGNLVNAIVGLEQGLKEGELHRTQAVPSATGPAISRPLRRLSDRFALVVTGVRNPTVVLKCK